MSNINNSELLHEAYALIEEYTGTLWERILLRDIKDNDLEALAFHVKQASDQSKLEHDEEIKGSRREMPDVY